MGNFFMLKKIYIFFLLSFSSFLFAEMADLIVFSYDRPLQLFASLESVEKWVSNLASINVIYRASNNDFFCAYEEVKNSFPNCNFYRQNKQEDFKILLVDLVFFKLPNNYILFGVDDIVIKDYVDLSDCIFFLKKTGAYGFYFRLGMNINKSYMLNMETDRPKCVMLTEDVYSLTFSEGKGDWAHPNNLDMTIYKKEDIKSDIIKTDFFDPVSFECFWNNTSNYNKQGLFFKESKVINVPINVVNESCLKNRNMNRFSTQNLLDIFNRGLKIDIAKFYKIKNNSPHMEVDLNFIQRKMEA